MMDAESELVDFYELALAESCPVCCAILRQFVRRSEETRVRIGNGLFDSLDQTKQREIRTRYSLVKGSIDALRETSAR